MTGYTVFREPPPNRVGTHEGDQEEHFPEASVMLAYAMHLLELGAQVVEIHADGEQVKRHDVRGWLVSMGFSCDNRGDRCVGRYTRGGQMVAVDLKPGVFDVVAVLGRQRVSAECKGGITNTRHNGARSRLRKGLQEAVGQLLSRPQGADERQIAVVPRHAVTVTWSRRLIPRVSRAGIEIALVNGDGTVEYVVPA